MLNNVNYEEKDCNQTKNIQKTLYSKQERLLEKIIEDEKSESVVRSLSEEILYFVSQCLPVDQLVYVLAKADTDQWEYFFDMKVWDKNKINYMFLSEWITAIFISNSEKFSQWLFYKKTDILELYLCRILNIKILNKEEDKYYLKKEYFTNDGLFYFSFKKNVNSNTQDNYMLKIKNKVVKNLLFKLASIDLLRYQNVLLESSQIIFAEIEEKLLINRNIRLIEKAFPSYEKSINIYKTYNFKKIKKVIIKKSRHFVEKLSFEKKMEKFYNYKNIKLLNNTQKNEFYFICNKSIIANKKDINSLNDLYKVISKLNNNIILGIQILSKYKLSFISNSKKTEIMKNYSLEDVFKIFISRISITKRITKRWYSKSWSKENSIKIILWNKKSDSIIRTLIFDSSIKIINNKLKFKQLKDIKSFEKKLQLIFDLDKLFSKVKIGLYFFKNNNKLSYKNLLLNAWILNSMYFYKKNLITKKTILRNFYKILLINIKKNKKHFLLWISKSIKTKKSLIPKNLKKLLKMFDLIKKKG